jgi:predicted ATPase
MKIKKIKWKDHPILGDLLLDLVDGNSGDPYRTIVLAGENGTGKSTILEELGSFLNLGPFPKCEYIEYIVKGISYTAVPASNSPIDSFFDIKDISNVTHQIRTNRNNNFQEIETTENDPRRYGCVISKARSDFKTEKITGSKTSTLDTDKYEIDGSDDFTSLKQLVVDVVQHDNSDYANRNKALGTNSISWESFYPDSKIFRFKSAFDNFFERLTFDGVADFQDQKEVRFSKNGKSISIDSLSTGEKQIVFRGIHLLKNSKKLEDAVAMIDEPELSMHPRWQKKILGFYKELFTRDSSQFAQLFFATHSDHVLKQALESSSEVGVIVLENGPRGLVPRKVDLPFTLPTLTSAEVNYKAFNLLTNDYHIELYGWLQEKNNLATVKSCDAFIAQHTSYDGQIHNFPSRHGGTPYSTLPTYIRNTIHHPNSMRSFSEQQMSQSIELLISMLT